MSKLPLLDPRRLGGGGGGIAAVRAAFGDERAEFKLERPAGEGRRPGSVGRPAGESRRPRSVSSG